MIQPVGGGIPEIPLNPSSNGSVKQAYNLVTKIQQALDGQGGYKGSLYSLIHSQLIYQETPYSPGGMDFPMMALVERERGIASDLKNLDKLMPSLPKAAQFFVNKLKDAISPAVVSSMYPGGKMKIIGAAPESLLENAPNEDTVNGIANTAAEVATDLSNLGIS